MNAATRLAILRLHDADDGRLSFFNSRQFDARQLVFALGQVLAAERLEQVALAALGIDPAVGDALTAERQRFEDALAGIKDMRDALMHFDEWPRGEGRGPTCSTRGSRAASSATLSRSWPAPRGTPSRSRPSSRGGCGTSRTS